MKQDEFFVWHRGRPTATAKEIRSIGTCHTCKREPCAKPAIKAKHPDEGCCEWKKTP